MIRKLQRMASENDRKAPTERLRKEGKLRERLYCRENTRTTMAIRKVV
jgi:hypothetical protein